MRWLTDLLFRAGALFRPGRMERDLGEEVAFHLEAEAAKLTAEGWPAEAAGREARRRFGGIAAQRERTRAAWGVSSVHELWSDVRHTFRQCRRRPGFSLVAVLTLALGLGATVAIFSVVRGLLLQPLPVLDEQRLQVFWHMYNWRGVEFDHVRERDRVFDGIAAYSTEGVNYRTGGGSMLLVAGTVSAELFDVLGVHPALGRRFSPGDDRPGAEAVVILSWGLWQQEFGGDPAALGRRMLVDGRPRTVIGVMPRGFYFPTPEYRLWVPLDLDVSTGRYQGSGYLVLLGRVRPEVTAAGLESEVEAIARALGDRFTYPEAWDKTQGAHVVPLREYLLGDVRPALLLLFGASGLVLLMACANAAALVLARTTDRASEMALRTALGAGRGRLVRQIVTESVTLSLIAGLLGAAIAAVLFGGLIANLPLPNGLEQAVTIQWSTFLVGLLLAVLAGIAVSALPVRHILAGRLAGVTGTRAPAGLAGGAGRAHAALVAAEVTLAVVLVAGATLLIRSVDRLYRVPLGMDPSSVVILDVVASREEMEPAVRRQFFVDLGERAGHLPGVQSVGFTNRLPLRDRGWQGTVEVASRPDLGGPLAPNSLYRVVTPGYFEAMGMSIVLGRGPEPGDRAGRQPVAWVSEAFVRTMWPGDEPLGQLVRTPVGGDTAWFTVVGVVGEARMSDLRGDNPLVLYIAYDQSVMAGNNQTLAIRSSQDPSAVIGAVRALVAELDERVAVDRATTMDAIVTEAMAEPLRLRLFLALFGGLALVLGGVGVYGVVAYTVSRRRPEFGVRVALGAVPSRVLGEVIRGAMVPVVAGTALGLTGTVAISRLVAGFLYGVAPTDPASLGLAALILLLAGSGAALVPAVRAARVDPVEALRAE